MTTTFAGDERVPGGYYLNALRWTVVPIAGEGGRLPAGAGTWRRVSTVAALALAPILGVTFLMALPVIGLALVASALVAPVLRLLRGGTSDLAATITPGFVPGEAHLTGRLEAAGAGAFTPDARLEPLAREIAARRRRR